MGPNPSGPLGNLSLAIRYSGLGVRETWILLEISWKDTKDLAEHALPPSPFGAPALTPSRGESKFLKNGNIEIDAMEVWGKKLSGL